jgi:hypothetical protein
MLMIERDAPSIQVIDSPEIKHTDWDTAERVPDTGWCAHIRNCCSFEQANDCLRFCIFPSVIPLPRDEVRSELCVQLLFPFRNFT